MTTQYRTTDEFVCTKITIVAPPGIATTYPVDAPWSELIARDLSLAGSYVSDVWNVWRRPDGTLHTIRHTRSHHEDRN